MGRTIELLVSLDGKTQIQTLNYAGNACVEASRWLENALGLVVAEQKTTEFFQTEKATQQIEQ